MNDFIYRHYVRFLYWGIKIRDNKIYSPSIGPPYDDISLNSYNSLDRFVIKYQVRSNNGTQETTQTNETKESRTSRA